MLANIKGIDSAFPAFSYETIPFAAILKPFHLFLSISPLLNIPLVLFFRTEKKNVSLMSVHALCNRVASTPLTPHLYNGLSTDIWSFRLGGTYPESQNFWVTGHAPAFPRGMSTDDALCNGCNGSLL